LSPFGGGRGRIKTYTMKKIHILGIVVIAVAIGVIFTSLQSSATYSDFGEAAANPDTEYHVVGKLNKTAPVQYDPKINADECSFMMLDNKGVEKKLFCTKVCLKILKNLNKLF